MKIIFTIHRWPRNSFDVYHTIAGGRAWRVEHGISRIVNGFLRGLFMLDIDLEWAIGHDGWIFNYAPAQMTSIFIELDRSTLTSGFYFYQLKK